MAETYNIETSDGFHTIEFDPDVFRSREVHIRVDRKRVATMPYPKPRTPYHEVAFSLGGQELVAVAHLSAGPNEPNDVRGLHYDVFVEGRSLSGGPSLDEARKAAPNPGAVYPNAFRFVDIVLRVTPAAAAPGAVIGVSRPGSGMGLPAIIALVALILGALTVATTVGSRLWTRIRGDASRSVAQRTAIGCGALLACYTVAFGVVLTVAIVIGTLSR